MKKMMICCLTVLCVFGLFGCGSKDEATTFESALLKEGSLIVGTSPDYPPFETLDANGELIGFDIDMMKELIDIINKQQKTNLTLEFKQVCPFYAG